MTWIKVPVLRGFEDIAEIWQIAHEHNAWIAGGYPRYMCSPLIDEDHGLVEAGDVDVFPQTDEEYMAIIHELNGRRYDQTFENDICVTYHQPDDSDGELPVVQVIKPRREGSIVTSGTLEEVIGGFDFSVIRIGLLSETEALADSDFMDDELNHRMVIKNIVCPISSVIRIAKYGRKGYFITIGEILKIFMDWDERAEEYREKILGLLEGKNELGVDLTAEDKALIYRLLRID